MAAAAGLEGPVPADGVVVEVMEHPEPLPVETPILPAGEVVEEPEQMQIVSRTAGQVEEAGRRSKHTLPRHCP